MDVRLRALLEDPREWERVCKSLLATARSKMRQCGFQSEADVTSSAVQGGSAYGPAYDFVSRAVIRAAKGYKASNGEPEAYLQVIVRRLVTDELEKKITAERARPLAEATTIRKALSRGAWPASESNEIEELPDVVAHDLEITVVELFGGASPELQGFLSTAYAQVEYSSKGAIDWSRVADSMGISRHKCRQLRERAKMHLERVLGDRE